jgi:hypothetical protein
MAGLHSVLKILQFGIRPGVGDSSQPDAGVLVYDPSSGECIFVGDLGRSLTLPEHALVEAASSVMKAASWLRLAPGLY